MSNTVIKIENLGKKYILGHYAPQRYIALRDVLADRTKRLFRRLRHPFVRSTASSGKTSEEFWALKDLSFNIHAGERVGIIGRNGAGKSTLLKILSRITEPTAGRVSIKGRVASLLEVGTGFHPELTGRENIFLSGAILGMSRAEITRNFDAIVDFADVEKFLDTPVKRYSSGMYVRLAFAVAAHLNTEILMIDEVLAVGDADFQKKCLGKMDEVSRSEGRTLLFVSHNMGAVSRLCSRAVCLSGGNIVLDTHNVSDGVKKYLSMSGSSDLTEWSNPGDKLENQYFKPLRFGIYDEDGKPIAGHLERGDKAWIEIEGIVEKQDDALCIFCNLYADDGTLITGISPVDQMETDDELPRLRGHFTLRCPLVFLPHLNIKSYTLILSVSLYAREWILQDWRDAPELSFSMTGTVSQSPYASDETSRPGLLAFGSRWTLERGRH